MSQQQDTFLEKSEMKTFDAEHSRKLLHNIAQYDKKVIEGKKQYADLELARSRGAALKQKSIENLEKNLIDFESNLKNGAGKLFGRRIRKKPFLK